MIGKTYEIPELIKDFTTKQNNKIQAHSIGMDHHAQKMRSAMKFMWATITETMPEVDTSKYVYQYCEEENIVKCTGLLGSD